MFFKLLNEPGDYTKNGIRVNLISATEVFTPIGKKAEWFELKDLEAAILFFGLEVYSEPEE